MGHGVLQSPTEPRGSASVAGLSKAPSCLLCIASGIRWGSLMLLWDPRRHCSATLSHAPGNDVWAQALQANALKVHIQVESSYIKWIYVPCARHENYQNINTLLPWINSEPKQHSQGTRVKLKAQTSREGVRITLSSWPSSWPSARLTIR